MENLSDLSLQDLNKELEQVEKKIEDEKALLKEAKNAHFQDGEVWLTYKLQFRRIDKIEDEKTNKPLFNKKQIEKVKNSLEKISELRKRKNELLLKKVMIVLSNELYEGIVDFENKTNHYLSYSFRIEDIKSKGEKLNDEQKYRYYARLDTELDRILSAFNFSEFKRFDGNMYFGLIEFFDSVEYIIEREKCPELERIAREKIKNLDVYAQVKEFKKAITMIDFDLILLPQHLVKTRELLGYEIDYLSKILKLDDRQNTNPALMKMNEALVKDENSTRAATVGSEGDEIIGLLRPFKRGELRKELKKYIKEFNLKEGVTVESTKAGLITRRLLKDGWDADQQSIAVTLRKLGYGEEWKRD